jgi:5-methylcytosine-specific restriction endonuclease McrA
LAKRLRACKKHKEWSGEIFKRDNYICADCGIRGGELHADHFPKHFSNILREFNIKTFEEAMNCKELWDINNGQTRCKKCHFKRHKIFLKSEE